MSVITQSEIRNKKCSPAGWAVPTVTCHGAKHVWVDVTPMVPRSTTHAVLSKLIDKMVFHFGGWLAARVTIKGAHLKSVEPLLLGPESQGSSKRALGGSIKYWNFSGVGCTMEICETI